MKQLTLRDIPEDIEREIRRIAREQGTSINKTVRELHCEAIGIEHSSDRKRDLSDFTGFWDDEEAAVVEDIHSNIMG